MVCVWKANPGLKGIHYAVIRLDAPIDVFLRRISTIGSTQHWLMAYGSVLPEIEAFCALTNLPLETITLLKQKVRPRNHGRTCLFVGLKKLGWVFRL